MVFVSVEGIWLGFTDITEACEDTLDSQLRMVLKIHTLYSTVPKGKNYILMYVHNGWYDA